MSQKVWLSKYNNGLLNQTHGQVELVVMDAIQLKVMFHVLIAFLYYVFYIIKQSIDHFMTIHHWQYHIKILIEDIIMDGLVEFSLLLHLLEVMMLTHMLLVINFVKIIGVKMLNLPNLKMASILATWIQDLEKLGDSGIGNYLNVEDGLFGDISTPIIMEEHGLGLITNHTQTVDQFDQNLYIGLHIYLF